MKHHFLNRFGRVIMVCVLTLGSLGIVAYQSEAYAAGAGGKGGGNSGGNGNAGENRSSNKDNARYQGKGSGEKQIMISKDQSKEKTSYELWLEGLLAE
ncbi:MAG: hypothetical protein OEY09_09865 [Gammaproteobacteria bacterium]|nr:hypothetical protein [Gammaproteobacteria bacterium]